MGEGTRGRCSGSAMVLRKLPVPGRLADMDNSRSRAYCAYNRCWVELFGHFLTIECIEYFTMD